MQVTVKLYGNLRKYAKNGDDESLVATVDDGSDVEQLIADQGIEDVTMIVLNDELADGHDPLHDGDVMQLFSMHG